jgi:hypothetical protein
MKVNLILATKKLLFKLVNGRVIERHYKVSDIVMMPNLRTEYF